ncbi:gamma-glutamylcyclotransferase family protein [Sorangium sp. So ce1024]|uniref:gamma-glutamylcyclotransferase family protein n=1 Tax=unclassified Sorangium TaxID=2621164 RepID=UPI003F0C98BD
MTTSEISLFVYDNLMKGEDQHEWLASARSLGEATTTPTYALVDLGTCGALVEGGLVAVSGELYALSPTALAALDVHRGHPILHRRAAIRLADGREAQAYLLSMEQAAGCRRVREGDWRKRRGAPGAVRSRDNSPLVSWAKRRFDPPR